MVKEKQEVLAVTKPAKKVESLSVGGTGSCFWLGTAPACDPDGCPSGFKECRNDKCGAGAYCVFGSKRECCSGACPVPESAETIFRVS